MSGEIQAVCASAEPGIQGCGRTPPEIDEYSPEMTGTKYDPDTYVWMHEGTLNRRTGHFLCTSCYIKNGQPSSPLGWKA